MVSSRYYTTTTGVHHKTMQSSSDPDPIRASQQRSIQALPNDAIASILQHCSDFESIMNLAKTSDAIKMAIYCQQWQCGRCSTLLFADADLTTPVATQPFMCAVCNDKICGERVDYDKRRCRPQKCDGCGKVECHRCMEEHLGDNNTDGTENFCRDCQDQGDCNMGAC